MGKFLCPSEVCIDKIRHKIELVKACNLITDSQTRVVRVKNSLSCETVHKIPTLLSRICTYFMPWQVN